MYDHERSLVQEYAGRPFALVGVNTDEDPDEIREVAREKNLIWRSFRDPGGQRISREYRIEFFPTIMLIDHKGVIRSINPNDIDLEISKLVKEAEQTVSSDTGAEAASE